METYKIHVKCTNCQTQTTTPDEMVKIEKGITISEKLLHEKCKNCGCKKLLQVFYV